MRDNILKSFHNIICVEIIKIYDSPNKENAVLAKGCNGVSVITTAITKEIIEIWHEQGVKHISTRTIGYDHIDLKAAKANKMIVSNVTYSTASVANITVMIMLIGFKKNEDDHASSNWI